MAHVARVDENGNVIETHVINNWDLPNNGEFSPETELAAQKFQRDLGLEVEGHTWLLTSYNTREGIYYNNDPWYPAEDQSKGFRQNFAGPGMIYDKDQDAFLFPDDWEVYIPENNLEND